MIVTTISRTLHPLAAAWSAPGARAVGRLACVLSVALLPTATRALDWQPGQGYRSAALAVPAQGQAGFTLLSPADTGVAFTNVLAEERYLTNTMLLNGSGVALGDVDGDGWCDLYFCGLDGPNVLYRNLGNWKFEDITAAAGVACPELAATGAALADIDGDGDLDLIVNSLAGGTHVFLNDGKGRFTRMAMPAPLNPFCNGTSLALGDLDGDGSLDLYIANYRAWTVRDHPDIKLNVELIDGRPQVTRVDGRPVTDPDLVGRFSISASGEFEEHGEADLVCLNDGKGHFTPQSFVGGAFLDEDGKPLREPPFDWGLSVMFRDLDGDGAPDIYVCNDFDAPDRIWLNRGHGQFQALPRLALRHTSRYSMGVDFADINRDGHDDFFVVDMLSPKHQKRHNQIGNIIPVVLPIGQLEDRPQYSLNTLFLNRGDGTYAEIAPFSGVTSSEWSWMPAFLDVDLDGYEDLIIATGHQLDAMNADVTRRALEERAQKKLSATEILRMRTRYAHFALPKIAFRNRGDLTFAESSEAWGFTVPTVSNGMAFADLDHDGDLDLVINNLNGGASIYRNNSAAPRVAVRLRGKAPNTQGIGAKVWLYGGAVPAQSQEIICGGRFLSSDEPVRAFAAGAASNRMRLEVRWRGGLVSVVSDVQANRVYEVDEAGAGAKPVSQETAGSGAPGAGAATGGGPPSASPGGPGPFFEDVSPLLGHTHHEDPFDDFERQSLLPNRLSQLSPGVCWHDLDSDGWEDLIIASGRGGRLACFRNNGQGGFVHEAGPPFQKVAARDQTTVLGVGRTLFVGLANYEDGTRQGGHIGMYSWTQKASGESVLGPDASTGPIALGDIDGDGDLDLFIGGRVVAGRYPEPATSLLLRNDGGRFVVVQRWTGGTSLGLVSGAVFGDLDGDGLPELVLACDWGPVRILKRREGNFVEVTAPLGLASHLGWWNGVALGDFDGDGRLDIVASNWGRNHMCRASAAHPRRLYYGDVNGDGRVEVIEAYFNDEMGVEVPDRNLKAVSAAIPFISEKTGSFEAYGKASLEEIYGDRLKGLKTVAVTTFESTLFLNRGDHFEARSLPAEAQFAPAFGVCVGDLDGDGNEDVFLSQNFFATHPEAWRHDAGRGLWLRGDGAGGFVALSGQESGVKVYGEQRGCALADYDGDGRVDLVVSQNGAATKLYRNVRARPGLRVRLEGPETNPALVGTAMQLVSGDRAGPLREVHAGSGYWSQDGAVQVLASPTAPSALRVRWPGGAVGAFPVPPGAREVSVSPAGGLKVVKQAGAAAPRQDAPLPK